MTTEATLIIDGVERAGIEFVVNTGDGATVKVGTISSASTAIISEAFGGTDLILDGQPIVITSKVDDNTLTFKSA